MSLNEEIATVTAELKARAWGDAAIQYLIESRIDSTAPGELLTIAREIDLRDIVSAVQEYMSR